MYNISLRRGSVASTIYRLRVVEPGFASWKEQERFFSSQNVHSGSKVHPASYLLDTGFFIRG